MTFGRHIGATASLCGVEPHGRPVVATPDAPEQSATRVGGTVPRAGDRRPGYCGARRSERAPEPLLGERLVGGGLMPIAAHRRETAP
jgi:hypothetical protein